MFTVTLMSGSIIIDFIGKWLSNKLKTILQQTESSSILTNGSTDVSIKEKEANFAITFDPSPLGTDEIGIKITDLELEDLNGVGAKNVLACMKHSTASIFSSADFMSKLVGFGSDGASVNVGKNEGVKTLLHMKTLG